MPGQPSLLGAETPRGFIDAAEDSQGVFRAVLAAMAEPGRIITIGDVVRPPVGLAPATAALLLTLADFETTVWLDDATDHVCRFLRFETGCQLTPNSGDATLAVITRPTALPAFERFAQGTLDYPDRAATVIVQLDDLSAEPTMILTGPGVASARPFSARPLPTEFIARMAANRAGFPLGVDLVLTAGQRIAALPRSVTVTRTGA